MIQDKTVDAIEQVGGTHAPGIEVECVVLAADKVLEGAEGAAAFARHVVNGTEVSLPITDEGRREVVQVRADDLADVARACGNVDVAVQSLEADHVFPDVERAECTFGRRPSQLFGRVLLEHGTAEVLGHRRALLRRRCLRVDADECETERAGRRGIEHRCHLEQP